jgi:putative ABC transport system permease protein
MSLWGRLLRSRKRMTEDLDKDIRDYIEGETQRTASNPLLLVNAVRSAVASQGNSQPVSDVWRYSDYLAAVTLSHDRFSAVLSLLFGTLGVALCASGVYSVVSFALSRRTHEIGIRMALGGQRDKYFG